MPQGLTPRMVGRALRGDGLVLRGVGMVLGWSDGMVTAWCWDDVGKCHARMGWSDWMVLGNIALEWGGLIGWCWEISR